MSAATLRRISTKALARYQVILLGEQRHIRCEQLAQGCCPNSAAVGVEPATSGSRVQRSNHYTTEPVKHRTKTNQSRSDERINLNGFTKISNMKRFCPQLLGTLLNSRQIRKKLIRHELAAKTVGRGWMNTHRSRMYLRLRGGWVWLPRERYLGVDLHRKKQRNAINSDSRQRASRERLTLTLGASHARSSTTKYQHDNAIHSTPACAPTSNWNKRTRNISKWRTYQVARALPALSDPYCQLTCVCLRNDDVKYLGSVRVVPMAHRLVTSSTTSRYSMTSHS